MNITMENPPLQIESLVQMYMYMYVCQPGNTTK